MLGLVAVVLATVNMVGGFVVTDRMLEMFKAASRRRPTSATGRRSERPVADRRPGLPGRRRLLHPRAQGAVVARVRARSGNLIGAAGALLAVRRRASSAEDLDHLALILVAIAVGAVVGVPAARRVAMTAMPQLVALFNGVGGGAAALVASLELSDVDRTGGFPLHRRAVHGAWSARCRSPARS